MKVTRVDQSFDMQFTHGAGWEPLSREIYIEIIAGGGEVPTPEKVYQAYKEYYNSTFQGETK